MAIPTFFQMKYGRPSFTMEFDTSADSNTLFCKVTNVPITHWWLRWIGVKREAAQGVAALVEVNEIHNKRLFQKYMAKINTGDTRAVRVTIPPSHLHSHISLVEIFHGKEPRLTDDEQKLLPEGVYIVKVTLNAGEDILSCENILVVKTEGVRAYWESGLRKN